MAKAFKVRLWKVDGDIGKSLSRTWGLRRTSRSPRSPFLTARLRLQTTDAYFFGLGGGIVNKRSKKLFAVVMERMRVAIP